MATTRKKAKPKSPAVRMAAYRARMRARGLKPVVLWLPDVKNPNFEAECRRQALALARSDPAGDEILSDIEKMYVGPDA